MNSKPIIRDYTNKDKEAILHLLRQNTPQYFSPEEENDLIYYLDHEIEHYFVMEAEGMLVGCGGINLADSGTVGKISWDIMHPQFQGRGLGKQLLEYRINKLKQMPGVKKIVVRTSQLVYKFYECSGFILREQVPDYWAEGFDLYGMEYVD